MGGVQLGDHKGSSKESEGDVVREMVKQGVGL